MSASEIVRLDRVGRVYHASPPHWALRGVSLSIERGSFCLLQGPSGSGKTTLLGVIAGMERASEGSVRTLGRDLMASTQADLRTMRRLHVGFVFQDFRLIATLTAQENVALAFRLRGRSRGEARAQSREELARLGLEACRDRRPAELSGGEKQRVAIARALAGDPELLLADEPTANLDSVTGRETVALLRERARRRGATVLVASHDPRLAETADRVLQLLDGRIAGMEVRSCA